MLHLTEVQHLAKERPIDIAFISMKSYDTEWATTMIRQYLAPSGYVVSLAELHQRGAHRRHRRLGQDGRRDRRDPLGRALRAGQDPPHRRQEPAGPRGLPGRRGARPRHPADRGTGRDDPHHRHLQGHRQSVGRALVEAVRQRHAQRRLGGERAVGQRDAPGRPDPPRHRQARRRGGADRPGAGLPARRHCRPGRREAGARLRRRPRRARRSRSH